MIFFLPDTDFVTKFLKEEEFFELVDGFFGLKATWDFRHQSLVHWCMQFVYRMHVYKIHVYSAQSSFQNFLGLGLTKRKEHFWAILSVT